MIPESWFTPTPHVHWSASEQRWVAVHIHPQIQEHRSWVSTKSTHDRRAEALRIASVLVAQKTCSRFWPESFCIDHGSKQCHLCFGKAELALVLR